MGNLVFCNKLNRFVVDCYISPGLEQEAVGDVDFRIDMNRAAGRISSVIKYNQVVGSMMELAFEEHFNVAHESRRLDEDQFELWNYDLKLADIGIFECKGTTYHSGSLVIPEKYCNSDIGVLGVWYSNSRIMKMVGWLEVKDCKAIGTDINKDGNYWVDQSDLKCMSRLSPVREMFNSKKDKRWVYENSIRKQLDALGVMPLSNIKHEAKELSKPT